MNKDICSFGDSLDAVFISSCGRIKSCPKHFFYYTSWGCILKRIKIQVNKESKKILINYLITLKKKLNFYADRLIKQGSQANASDLEGFNEGINFCDKIYWKIISKKFVSMKLILSPFEYFLTQPSEKAQEFIDYFEIQDWSWGWYEKVYRRHVFDYNYFKYEDSKYIHGWAYKSSYNKDRLSNFCFILFYNFMKMSEYEMAFEILQNAISYKEYYDHSSIKILTEIAENFSKVFESYIKDENFSQSLELWKKQNISRPTKNERILSTASNWVILAFLRNNKVNIKKYLRKAKKLCIEYNYENDEIYWNQELGWWYYENKRYDRASKFFVKSVNYYKKLAYKNDYMEILIEAYLSLAKAYSGLKYNRGLRKILKKLQKMPYEIKGKFWYFAAIGEIYFLLNDFDKAFNWIRKCIDMSKQNEFKNSYELSGLYLYLANIHTWKGEFLKAHESLANSKSLCSNLLFNDPILKKIYKAHTIFYINSQRYNDALEYITLIENNCSEHDMLFAKLSFGIAYFWMLNFDKALEFFTEVKSKMMPKIYKNELFIANAYIGELYSIKGNWEIADKYFIEAINLVDYYDVFEIDIYLKSSSFVFNHFYANSEYQKCGFIFSRVDDILKSYKHMKFRLPYYWILCAKLYIAVNEIEEAEVCLNNVEKLLNISKSQRNIRFSVLNCLSDYIEVAKIYIDLVNASTEKKDENYLKAEKILINAKRIAKKYLRNDLSSKADIYHWLGILFFKKQKFETSKHYCELSLELYKKYQYNLNEENNLIQISI